VKHTLLPTTARHPGQLVKHATKSEARSATTRSRTSNQAEQSSAGFGWRSRARVGARPKTSRTPETRPNLSREAAAECSPRRKPWEKSGKVKQP
jgi:hypothetical protein